MPKNRQIQRVSAKMNQVTLAVGLLALVNSPESSNAFTSPPLKELLSTRRTDVFSLEGVQGRQGGKRVRKVKLSKNTASRAVLTPRVHKKQPIRSDQHLHRLTHEEEMSLLREMRSHSADSVDYQAARQTLILHNLPLVQSIVSKAMKSHPRLVGSRNQSQIGAALSMDDLLNEGTIGLAEAIDKYDFEYSELKKTDSSHPKGNSLGTYATYWIRARITRAIQSREHAFRFPEMTLQASHRLVKAARVLELEWSTVIDLQIVDTPEKEKLRSSLFGAAVISSEAQFREAIRIRNLSSSTTTTHLESWMTSPSSGANLEVNEAPESGSQHIHDTLSKFLRPKEVQVLSLRYGLTFPDETQKKAVSKKTRVYRDYQAEAEEELFGPTGILSHYSAMPSGQLIPAAFKKEATSTKKVIRKSLSTASKQKALSTLTKSHRVSLSTPRALLPFKEVGKKMQVSGEYCRRLCGEALRKLSLAAEEGRLAESDFLLGW